MAGHRAALIALEFTDGLQPLKERLHELEIGRSGYFFVVDSRPGETLEPGRPAGCAK